MTVRLRVGHSHIVLVRVWSGRIRELGMWIGRIGGSEDCKAVVVVAAAAAGSMPWRPEMGLLRMQDRMVEFFCV